ncbi:MAG: LytTR family DNA-binding domain-containing protein [Bacteroidales bacterium]|nr:LytTR family DNA-binding domain-containing protein [Bacteroidales bacterium]
MKALIIEDEAVAADRLESLVKEVDSTVEIMAKLGSVKEAVKYLSNHKTDLIFLDIQLSDGLSFSIFEQVMVNTPVIFTTAYDQYAIKAFKLNSIDYLLKPIRRDELAQSLEKYHQLQSAFRIDFDQLRESLQGKQPAYKKRFLIQYGEKIKKINTDDIAYFYAMQKSVFLKSFSNSDFPVDYTLDKLENLVDPENFFRINRKFLVNMDAITDMTAWSRSRIKLDLKPAPDDDNEAVVSIDRSAGFKQWLNK